MGERKILAKKTVTLPDGKLVEQLSKSDTFEPITFAKVKDMYESVSRGMIDELKLQPGSRVLILANTRLQWMVTALAVLRSGGTVVTSYIAMTDKSIEFGMQQTKPDVIVTEVSVIDVSEAAPVNVLVLDRQALHAINSEPLNCCGNG